MHIQIYVILKVDGMRNAPIAYYTVPEPILAWETKLFTNLHGTCMKSAKPNPTKHMVTFIFRLYIYELILDSRIPDKPPTTCMNFSLSAY